MLFKCILQNLDIYLPWQSIHYSNRFVFILAICNFLHFIPSFHSCIYNSFMFQSFFCWSFSGNLLLFLKEFGGYNIKQKIRTILTTLKIPSIGRTCILTFSGTGTLISFYNWIAKLFCSYENSFLPKLQQLHHCNSSDNIFWPLLP